MDPMTRRQLLGSVGALAPAALLSIARPRAQPQSAPGADAGPLPAAVLPRGVRARVVNNVNGIRMHVLEAGHDGARRPAVLLVHGFPELAYSWRKVMLPIAAAGYHVIAPDLRGYGRTGATEVTFDDDLSPWRTLNEVTDMVALVSAFGYRSVAAVVGHDFGSPVAAWCSVVRPDIFRSTVLMSAPFAGAPAFPFNSADAAPSSAPSAQPDTIYDELARLSPPRQHYQRYYSTRDANANMWHAPQGLHAFLRAYYHMKSADWKENHPAPLAARTAAEWAKLPRYYIMDLTKGMAETVAPEMPSASAIAANTWLPDEELRVYSTEYGRTGFQGGLQSYRVGSSGRFNGDLQAFAGRTIDQPSMFIAGRSDWGAYQNPGALERMQKTACTHMVAAHFVDGAGHWVQQEQPARVSALIVEFLQRNTPRDRSNI
jgi:pimeloyl-ACP methyl ester carboxylesterase